MERDTEELEYRESAIRSSISVLKVLLNFNREMSYHITIYEYLIENLKNNDGRFRLEESFATEDGVRNLLQDLNAPKKDLREISLDTLILLMRNKKTARTFSGVQTLSNLLTKTYVDDEWSRERIDSLLEVL